MHLLSGQTFHTIKFLILLTVIQFWWIAIWGIAYILIDAIAGNSKLTELILYGAMLCGTALLLHMNPDMIEKL